jgi:hypothetical protein
MASPLRVEGNEAIHRSPFVPAVSQSFDPQGRTAAQGLAPTIWRPISPPTSRERALTGGSLPPPYRAHQRSQEAGTWRERVSGTP